MICKSKNTNILSCHKGIPPTVVLDTICLEVSASIQFNNQFSAGAVKGRNVGAERLLTAEMEGMSAQIQIPEFPFVRGHIFSQFPCT